MLTVCSLLVLATADKALAAVTYADGEYTVSYQVLKDTSDEISATADYMVDPATIIIEDGSAHVEMTLKNSSWWQEFKVKSAATGAYNDVTVLSEDPDEQTRVVTFAIADPEAVLDAKIHIVVTGIPGFEYDNRYDIRFKFDTSVIPAASQTTPEEQTPVSDGDEDVQSDGEQAGASSKTEEAATDTPASSEASDAESTDQVELVEDPAVSDNEASEEEQSETVDDSDLAEGVVADGSNDRASGSDEDAAEGSADLASETDAADKQDPDTESSSSSTMVIVIIVLVVVILGAGFLIIRKRSRK